MADVIAVNIFVVPICAGGRMKYYMN